MILESADLPSCIGSCIAHTSVVESLDDTLFLDLIDMDYLPLPESLSDHPLVEELSGIPYDNLGFEGYDSRQGWNIKLLREGNIKGARRDWNEYSQACFSEHGDRPYSYTGEELVQFLIGPFIQNWLIYGLFQEALGRAVSRDEATFLRTDGKGEVRRYLKLQSLFEEFVSRKDVLAQDSRWHTVFPKYLDTATWILQDLDSHHDELGAPVIPGMTAVTLSALVRTMHDYAVIWCTPHITDICGDSRIRWLEYKLEAKGWCPERIRRMRSELGPEGLYYASLLDVADDGKTHNSCSGSVCVAYNVKDHDQYRLKHSIRYCECKDKNCAHEAIDCKCRILYDVEDLTERVRASVRKGQIPLLSAHEVARLELVDSHQGQDYVAISHVWSDGMGNPKQNAILPCQIRLLEFCVRKLLGALKPGAKPYFWLDTVCVPVLPGDARDAAIENMHRVYADASVVLVVTQDLVTKPLPTSLQEIAVRICQSKWLKRLWTMQEGVLAKSLAFQFEDHAIDYDFLDDRLHDEIHKTSSTSALIGSRANLMVSNLRTMRSDATTREETFDSLWLNIRHRATSRESDQAICASILCNLDLAPVLAAEDDDKMAKFWTTCKALPLGILWANGPRMGSDGMRWAPKALLNPSTWAVPPPKTGMIATVASDGLHFSGVDACYLEGIDLPKIEDSMIELQLGDETVFLFLSKKVENPAWTELSPYWNSVCLLWNALPTVDRFSNGVLVSCKGLTGDEILDDIPSERTQPLHARWLAQVALFSKDGEWASFIGSFPTRYDDGEAFEREKLDVFVHPERAKRLSRTRQWCVY